MQEDGIFADGFQHIRLQDTVFPVFLAGQEGKPDVYRGASKANLECVRVQAVGTYLADLPEPP